MFKFSPFWGERLIVEGPGGSFVLDLPMGVPTAILPPEWDWRRRGPPWAQSLWPELYSELQHWCQKYDYNFRVQEGATVVFANDRFRNPLYKGSAGGSGGEGGGRSGDHRA